MRAALALLLTAGTASAQIVSNPGLCTADGPEQELGHLFFLTSSSIEGHSAYCEWPLPVRFEPGASFRIPSATCGDGSGESLTTLQVKVNMQGRVSISGAFGLPQYFFPCDRWGYRG